MTTTPNDQLVDLHDRMPVVLPDDAWERWLDPHPMEPGELHALFIPTDDIELRIHPVGRGVNDVRRDGPDLIEPVIPTPVPTPATLGI